MVRQALPLLRSVVHDRDFASLHPEDHGSWAAGPLTNLDYRRSAAFVGTQYAESSHASRMARRRHSTGGCRCPSSAIVSSAWKPPRTRLRLLVPRIGTTPSKANG